MNKYNMLIFRIYTYMYRHILEIFDILWIILLLIYSNNSLKL
jgi:hypothetical protein